MNFKILVLEILLGISALTDAKSFHPLTENTWMFSMDGETPQRVRVPHTWNAIDGQTGGEYRRGIGQYSTIVSTSGGIKEGAVHVLDFGGVSHEATVWVNGQQVGHHVGAFGRFRMVAPLTGLSLLTVSADNSPGNASLPLTGDFNVFGGIYRPVGYWTLSPNTPVLDFITFGDSGVRFTQRNAISKFKVDVADMVAEVSLRCFGLLTTEAERKVSIRVELFYGKESEGIRVVNKLSLIRVPLNCTIPLTFSIPFTMRKPRLWNGRLDPFLYTAKTTVMHLSKVVDTDSTEIGIRSYFLDPDDGFFLNGKEYPLHGVAVHQDWLNLGWAIHNRHTLQNFQLLNELNATALRCAHYQHSEYTYKLADKFGIIVWAEIPVLELSPLNPQFYANAASHLRELIRQNYNRPSILFWSLANELAVSGKDAYPSPLVWSLQRVAKFEDPFRLTTMAINTKDLLHSMIPMVDSVAINVYHGWYGSRVENAGPDLDRYHKSGPRINFGISEYGAGASIRFHAEVPVQQDHTEEYQARLHEGTWPQLKARKYLWWKTVWNLADFASWKKSEGDTDGRNDKGLVTFDRTVKKDAFYYYKAQWNSEPMIHILSSRFTVKRTKFISVYVYAKSVGGVWLTVNGVRIDDTALLNDSHVYLWEGVELKDGENTVVARSDAGMQSIARWICCAPQDMVPVKLSMES